MPFAEEGHRHVHFHVVPRMSDLDEPRRGPDVFAFLNVPETDQVPADERDELAARIGLAIGRER